MLGKLAKDWAARSLKIKELISRLHIPWLTYEAFCRNPASVLDILTLPDGVSRTINPNASVKVKDYEIQPIINQNERQCAALTDEEKEHIRRVLKPDIELMEFFGYCDI